MHIRVIPSGPGETDELPQLQRRRREKAKDDFTSHEAEGKPIFEEQTGKSSPRVKNRKGASIVSGLHPSRQKVEGRYRGCSAIKSKEDSVIISWGERTEQPAPNAWACGGMKTRTRRIRGEGRLGCKEHRGRAYFSKLELRGGFGQFWSERELGPYVV